MIVSRPLLKYKPITIQHEGALDVEQSDIGFEGLTEFAPGEERKGTVGEKKDPSYLENLSSMIPASIIVSWGILLGFYEAGLIGTTLITAGFIVLLVATAPFIYVTIDEKERQSHETFKMAMFQCLAGIGAFFIYALHLNAATPIDALPWFELELSITQAAYIALLYTVAIPAIVALAGMYSDWKNLSRPADPAT